MVGIGCKVLLSLHYRSPRGEWYGKGLPSSYGEALKAGAPFAFPIC